MAKEEETRSIVQIKAGLSVWNWEAQTRACRESGKTVVQVLGEPGRKAKTDSRMWVYLRSPMASSWNSPEANFRATGKLNDKSAILFEYTPTRNGDNAAKFLGGYSGYLVCDGYDGYNKLKSVTRCGCWAHARRNSQTLFRTRRRFNRIPPRSRA